MRIIKTTILIVLLSLGYLSSSKAQELSNLIVKVDSLKNRVEKKRATKKILENEFEAIEDIKKSKAKDLLAANEIIEKITSVNTSIQDQVCELEQLDILIEYYTNINDSIVYQEGIDSLDELNKENSEFKTDIDSLKKVHSKLTGNLKPISPLVDKEKELLIFLENKYDSSEAERLKGKYHAEEEVIQKINHYCKSNNKARKYYALIIDDSDISLSRLVYKNIEDEVLEYKRNYKYLYNVFINLKSELDARRIPKINPILESNCTL